MMWIKDPKTSKRSVSLTMLIVTGILCIAGAVTQMMGKIDSTSLLAELFYTSAALYGGRRLKFSKDGNAYVGDKINE